MIESSERLSKWWFTDDNMFDATVYARFEHDRKELTVSELFAAVMRMSTPVADFVQSERNLPDESTTIARRSAESR